MQNDIEEAKEKRGCSCCTGVQVRGDHVWTGRAVSGGDVEKQLDSRTHFESKTNMVYRWLRDRSEKKKKSSMIPNLTWEN